MHYVYVLRSLKDGNLYTGYTADLRSRAAAHSAGKVREVFLKSGSGKRYIRKQMSHYFSASKA